MKFNLCFLLSLYFTIGFSQKQLRLQQFSTEEGLSHSTITDIFQDSRGFMWIATYNGLNRFDGTSFHEYNYKEGSKTCIGSPETYKIFEDSKSRLWVGTSSGISLYNRDFDNFQNFAFRYKNHSMCPIRSILNAENPDELLLGTYGGLFLFNTNKVHSTFFALGEDETAANSILAMQKDEYGNIWIALEDGGMRIVKLSNNAIERNAKIELQTQQLKNKNVLAVCADKLHNIWMGTNDGCFYKYSHESGLLKLIKTPTNTFTEITSIIEKEPNKLWLSVNKKGVFVCDIQTEKFSELEYEKRPGNKMILSLYKDIANNLWIGSMNSGLYLYDELDKRFSFFATSDDIDVPIENNAILSICEDENGYIWMGTEGGGLIQYNNSSKQTKVFNKRNALNLPFNTVLSIHSASDGKVYFGTYHDGLYAYNPLSNTSVKYVYNSLNSSGLSDNTIWNLFEDNSRQLWIATNTGGLVKFDLQKQTFCNFKMNSEDSTSISSNSVRAICQDEIGRIWVGTVDGLNRFDPQSNSFTKYFHIPNNENSLSNNNVLSVIAGSSNLLYIGTLGGGMNVFNISEERFYRYSEKSGLISNTVYALQEDEQGNIWVSTDKGISKFDPLIQSFNNYNSKNGLYSSRFNMGASFKNKEGELFFGSINGACRFKPYYVKQNKSIPPVFLTDIKVFNKSLNLENDVLLSKSVSEIDTLILNYSQNFVAFKFASLNYSHAFNNQYAYKLEPIEKEWINAGNAQSASYTNLKPGNYIFSVKGSNNDGVWNQVPRSITIVIKPPFWQTIWFIGLVAVLFFYAAYSWYRRNLRQKLLLEKLVKQRTLELEETNIKIIEAEKYNAHLQQEQLNNALQTKSKELSRTVLIIMQKNKLLEELKIKLKEAIRNPKTVNIEYFRSVLRTISLNFSTSKEWKEFDAYFEEVHHNFIKTLKQQFPSLSNNDLRLCTLYRINVPAREISDMLNISVESLKKARYRLRKKLNLSPEDDLTGFLTKL